MISFDSDLLESEEIPNFVRNHSKSWRALWMTTCANVHKNVHKSHVTRAQANNFHYESPHCPCGHWRMWSPDRKRRVFKERNPKQSEHTHKLVPVTAKLVVQLLSGSPPVVVQWASPPPHHVRSCVHTAISNAILVRSHYNLSIFQNKEKEGRMLQEF